MKRRTLLAGAAAVTGGSLVGCAVGEAPPVAENDSPSPAEVPAGRHQVGVLTRPPASAVFAAFDITASGQSALEAVLRDLDRRIAANPGIEVTISVGASLFDHRYGLGKQRPASLTTMPSFSRDVLDQRQCHGDLLLQLCSDKLPRSVMSAMSPEGTSLRWSIDGFRHENSVSADGRPVDRNLFGFREGAGNPDTADGSAMDKVVWADPATEPSWTLGGTYQVIRIIRLATALWDSEPLNIQEAAFGRRKADGVPLGHSREEESFDYHGDPDGRIIALDSHIRRANPRTPESASSQILRRGYSYRRRSRDNMPDEGLLFVCFQQNIERGFATIQRRLNGEQLDKYVLTTGGGYFFTLPAPATETDYLGHQLVYQSR